MWSNSEIDTGVIEFTGSELAWSNWEADTGVLTTKRHWCCNPAKKISVRSRQTDTGVNP